MYYIGIDETNKQHLTHYCRNCGHVDQNNFDNSCILNMQIKKGEQKYNHIINEYTKLDPTLPRVYNIKCPNVACKTKTDPENFKDEVVYVRYDGTNLKYLYIPDGESKSITQMIKISVGTVPIMAKSWVQQPMLM